MQVLPQADETAILERSGEYTAAEIEAMQRTVLNIFERWSVRDADTSIILGGVSPKTLSRWRQGQLGRVSRDLADRMSYVLGIHKALRIVFVDARTGYRWMQTPNAAFDGKTPLDVLLRGGLDDLQRMRHYLDSVRGGW